MAEIAVLRQFVQVLQDLGVQDLLVRAVRHNAIEQGEQLIQGGRRASGGLFGRHRVLFFHGLHDFVCETVDSTLAEPMRAHCDRLSELTVPSGHWMAQEQPLRVNAGLARWLARECPGLWDR